MGNEAILMNHILHIVILKNKQKKQNINFKMSKLCATNFFDWQYRDPGLPFQFTLH